MTTVIRIQGYTLGQWRHDVDDPDFRPAKGHTLTLAGLVLTVEQISWDLDAKLIGPQVWCSVIVGACDQDAYRKLLATTDPE